MTHMYENSPPIHRRQAAPFRGDRFLRLTAEEADLVATVEKAYGFDPNQQQQYGLSGDEAIPTAPNSPTPPSPPVGRNPVGGMLLRYLLRRLAVRLLEWTDEQRG